MSVYLYLFHGRATPDEDVEDWGCEGPAIGPLDYVHTTYGSEDEALDDIDMDAEEVGETDGDAERDESDDDEDDAQEDFDDDKVDDETLSDRDDDALRP